MAASGTKKKKKWIKWVVIAAVVVLIFIIFSIYSMNAANNMFEDDPVTKRDIQTYHSFTGTVAPVTEENVVPKLTGLKIEKYAVEEGDEVKAGDVLVYLDASSIEDQIEELELSMSINATDSDISVKQAYNQLSAYRRDLKDGINSQMLSASQNLASAAAQFRQAERNYRDILSMNAAGANTTLTGAQYQVDSAYQGVRQAQIALDQADHAKRLGATAMNDQESLNLSYENAERALDSAWLSYRNAVASSKAAAIQSQSNTEAALDSYLAAQNSLLMAYQAYQVAERGAKDQLANLELQYEQAKNGANTALNELKLSRLYENLEDCKVKAPMDGVVTSLPKKRGDMTTATDPVATVTLFDSMKVKIKINEYDMAGAEEGKDVVVILNAIDKEYEGKISKIARTATAENGVSYFESEIEFPADELVRIGMSAEIHLITNDVKGALTVKSDTIELNEDGTAYVLVRGKDGKSVDKRDVECGASDGTYTEITKGVYEGETALKVPLSAEEMMAQMMMGE